MSSAIAAWIAHVTFWLLLAYGLAVEEINAKRAGVFVALWIAALVALRAVPYEPARTMFPSLVAVLDIVLVFMIFKGDIRLT
ncbi:MAG: hypothetical protein ACRD1U_18650 [Vicinamibacterales bacterium]